MSLGENPQPYLYGMVKLHSPTGTSGGFIFSLSFIFISYSLLIMKERFLPWFLLFCALGLSGTAAYYSVVGLSIVFVGVAIPVIIMGGFLEVSKIAIATYLHDKWKETYGALKIYLTMALIILSVITSIGIYGLLSTGFQSNIAKLEISDKKIKNIEVKKSRFEEIKLEYTKEKDILDKDISKLRDGLSSNTTTQTVDRQTGQIVTRANNANRQSFEKQLQTAQDNRDIVSKKIDSMNDSITKLDIKILDMESQEIEGNELGAIKYVSELSGWGINEVANLFILILIFVFDPLAITLVIATNQAFKANRKRKEDDITIEEKIVEIEKIVEVPVEVIKEVEKIVEVPVEVFVEKGKVIPNPEELFESDDLYMGIISTEETTTTTTTTVQEGPKVLRYTKNNVG
jgi:hypothetical protein